MTPETIQRCSDELYDAWLANTLGRLGLPFRAGEIILSGSQSPLLPVHGGDELVCTIGGLGSCRARFHGKAAV